MVDAGNTKSSRNEQKCLSSLRVFRSASLAESFRQLL